MAYYSAMKRKEVSLYAKTKVNLEKTMLRERSQSQKATYPRRPRINKSTETETRYWFPETGRKEVKGEKEEEGRMQCLPMVNNENVLELGAGDGYTSL